MTGRGCDDYRIYDGAGADSEPSEGFHAFVRHKRLLLLAMVAVFAAIALIFLCVGTKRIALTEILEIIFTFDNRSSSGNIIWNMRLLDLASAVIIGCGLSVCGVVMQCVLKNPLASPYTLGISNAAAFGAAFSIVVVGTGSMATAGISIDNPYATTVCAFAFSMIATAVILVLTKVTRVSAETMVLAGIAISAIFSAALSFLQYVSTDTQLANIVSWMFGDLRKASWEHDLIIFAVLAPVTMYFLYKRWDYNAMDAGDETAKGLGVNVEAERLVGLVLTSLLCSVIVSFFGVIAFVGLLGPHIARMLIGGDHRYLVPAAMLIGAVILALAELVGANMFVSESYTGAIVHQVIPVGIITSMLGGPLFVYLLVRRYRA